jgi:hypothetical protein
LFVDQQERLDKMWKAKFQKVISEVRIVIHPDPKYHGLA